MPLRAKHKSDAAEINESFRQSYPRDQIPHVSASGFILSLNLCRATFSIVQFLSLGYWDVIMAHTLTEHTQHSSPHQLTLFIQRTLFPFFRSATSTLMTLSFSFVIQVDSYKCYFFQCVSSDGWAFRNLFLSAWTQKPFLIFFFKFVCCFMLRNWIYSLFFSLNPHFY